MIDPCPSTSTMSASLRALQHEPLGGAGDEVGDDRVDGDPAALDEDARLPRGGERDALAPVARRASRSWSCVVILPMLQSEPTVRMTVDWISRTRPRGDDEVGRRAAQVVNGDSCLLGAARRARGRRARK